MSKAIPTPTGESPGIPRGRAAPDPGSEPWAVSARTFSVVGNPGQGPLAWFVEGLRATLEDEGFRFSPGAPPGCRVVLHVVDPGRPQPFRRKARATYVVALAHLAEDALDGDLPGSVRRVGYPLLIRSLANLGIFLAPRDSAEGGGNLAAHFVTLEQGHYAVPCLPGDEDGFFRRVYERMAPLATSHLVIDNEFRPDLPPELWEGDDRTRQLERAGQRLEALALLPAPFPLEEVLSPRDLRHVKKLFGIGGLSYGNLSARRDAGSFWMSASGVNKGALRTVGRDILLVRGYDPVAQAMILSVPPHREPRRVSVDAIEHWMIYTRCPDVGAIVHVHAWMEGVPSTEVNYPCGTLELAEAVAGRVCEAPEPARAVVGLRNHGLTITGPDLDDILRRIEGRLVPQVPMS